MSDNGKIFREAWIAGVKKYYPGEPKAGYVTGWDDTSDWERSNYREFRPPSGGGYLTWGYSSDGTIPGQVALHGRDARGRSMLSGDPRHPGGVGGVFFGWGLTTRSR